MALIECEGCGRRIFLIRSWASVTRCPRCGEPLVEQENATEAERRVRERLYGAGGRPADVAPPEDRRRSGPPRRVGAPGTLRWAGPAE